MVEGLSKAPGEAASAGSGMGAGVFLERADGLLVLEESLAGVGASAEGRLVWVAGRPGWARRPCCARSARAGMAVRVLWGVCEPLLTPHPLGAVRYR